ncbi:MAG: peptidoglycan editing factor PgeF [Chloroflexi bacterium]|nr:peptidoglycan editing factor PgeF [Chloroflexota bacterium]
MIRQNHGRLAAFHFKSLDAHSALRHGIFTRHGGVSPAPWASLNLSRATGDSASNVAENQRRLAAALGFHPRDAVTSSQVHGNTVRRAGRDARGGRLPDCDALISNEPGVLLLQRHADCPPVVLYDPVRRAIGLAHSGWRGTLANIAGELVQAMQEEYGSNPADMVAGIGPAIGACCYHVGNEVSQSFVDRYAHGHAWVEARADGRAYLNLAHAIEAQLREAGVRAIEQAELCTACHVDDFYSARAENRLNGCFGSAIALDG